MDDFQADVLDRLARIETKLSNGITKKQEDHENRLRTLERGWWIGIGALAIIQTVLYYVFVRN